MLATASAQVCVPLGHSSLYFVLLVFNDTFSTNRLYHHDLLRHKAAQKIQIKYNGIQLKHRYKIYGRQTI